MPFNLGATELIIILLILIMVFGASRLADIGGALGKGIREFRHATKDEPEPPANSASSTQATPASAENKCPSCGTVNPSSQAFCGQCGTRLARAA